jgi:hypothetical protein
MMAKGLNITIVDTIERGFERTIVYSDGSTIKQYWSASMRMWVCIPE